MCLMNDIFMVQLLLPMGVQDRDCSIQRHAIFKLVLKHIQVEQTVRVNAPETFDSKH